MFRKLLKPVGGMIMGLALLSGGDARAQTSGYVPPNAGPPPVPAATLGYAEVGPSVISTATSETAPGTWFNIDYLLWWIKDAPAPGPLVTTGSVLDDIPGAIGQPNTRVLLGEKEIGNNAFSGIRLQAGTWINEARTIGYEAGGFALQHKKNSQAVASDAAGGPFLARPIFDTQINEESIILLAVPGFQSGALIASSSTCLSGWDFNFNVNATDTGNFRADALFGFRAYYLAENLTISDFSVAVVDQGTEESSLKAGERLNARDRYRTSSNFYGGQIGSRLTWVTDRWITTSTIKLGIGVTDQLAELEGVATARNPGAFVGSGFLVNPGNAGRYYSNDFTLIPEFNLNLGYRVTRYATLRAGYTFIYWNDVVRPGNVFSRAINPGLVPNLQAFGTGPTAAPRATIETTDFWTQGLNIGVEFRF